METNRPEEPASPVVGPGSTPAELRLFFRESMAAVYPYLLRRCGYDHATAEELGLGELAVTRADLIALLAAQVQGEAQVTNVVVTDTRAIVTFDVVVQGETVIVPSAELVLVDDGDGRWRVDPLSFCTLAGGLGVPCP